MNVPRGDYPFQHFQSPTIAGTPEEIYALIDAYTGEFFADEVQHHEQLDMMIILPPLSYGGRFVKGLFFSQALDLVADEYPDLSQLFLQGAYSMWSSFPWARSADVYLTCYDNPERNEWFRRHNPDRSHIALVPLQDADLTNEYRMAPRAVAERDIDLLCVSRVCSLKNLPAIASALHIHRRKYPETPVRMTLIAGKPGAYDPQNMSDIERGQMAQIEQTLGKVDEYMDLVDHVGHFAELPYYYSRARAFVLGSLIEGKNRAINEAQSCNVPVICFKDYNRYARGSSLPFPSGSGLMAEWDAEDLADTIQLVTSNHGDFTPRANYISTNGRWNFLCTCLRHIEYYRKSVPDLPDNDEASSTWLDLAMQETYGISLYEFLYGSAPPPRHTKGLQGCAVVNTFYSEKFMI